ncbi:MAG: pyridoxal phosphate-dependent aminotransferase [Spirochaetes bacterium]|jgi:aspartate aminotransferase|nr:pyridoxal phosphate-dependent aminotransferase [Spirochaetota bacterium]
MPVADQIKASIAGSSWIRKMFEEGIELKKTLGADKVFDFTIGNPDVAPPEKYYSIAGSVATDRSKNVHGYMPNAGYENVREVMAKKASSDHACDVGANNVVMTVGAAGGLNVLFRALLNPDEEIVVPKPYFAEYGAYASNHKARLVPVESKTDFSIDIDAIDRAITDKTRIVLINSPHNPTGRVYSAESLEKLASLLKRHKEEGRHIYLVADEPYREIVYDGIVVPPVLSLYSESFVVTSFSKTLSLPGERIGYIAQNPGMDDCGLVMNALILCNRILGFVNAPAFIQRVVGELADEKVDVSIYDKRRKLFVNGLKEAGLEFAKPEGAFYLFVKSPFENDVDFVNHLKKYGVLVVPGSGFGGPGYVRMAYCIDEKIIEAALPIIKKAVSEIE